MVKTSTWLVVFLIAVLDNTIVSYGNPGSVIVTTANTNDMVVNSDVNVAASNGIAAVLDGIIQASVLL